MNCHSVFRLGNYWVAVSGSERGITRLTLPCADAATAIQAAGIDGDSIADTARFADLAARLSLYFRGHRVPFDDHLDLEQASEFRRAVWRETAAIPYGTVASYGEIAARIGRPEAARAVGGALHNNPIPIIIPCHRVVGANCIGGFGGGIDIKRKLLRLEQKGLAG